MNKKKEKYLIALAGLFHDIGKFYQRANPKKEDIPQEYHFLLKKDNYEPEFHYQHAAYSFITINTELKEGFISVFSEEEINFILEGVYHHRPKNEVQYLIQKADWVSSSERAKEAAIYDLEHLPKEIEEKLLKFVEKNPRLRSVFENIKLSKETEKKNYIYKVTPLEISKDVFPITLEKAFLDIASKGKEVEKVLGDYKIHWKNFRREFNEKLKNSKLRFINQPEKVFSLIYHILYKYLWCIPASTFDREHYTKHYPDISLFDHSRVLSAIASAFYDFNPNVFTQNTIQEFKEELKNKRILLHIKADISGIQKFIYNVYQGKGGVAKTLRGRSFYVALLPEVLSRYILNELGYPISNLLYSGGGIFEILVANTEENLKKIEEIQKEINKFLSSEFEADLGLSLGYYQYSPIQMMEKYEEVLINLNEALDNAKKEKFEKIIESGEIFELLNEKAKQIEENKIKCPVCQTYLTDENKEICDVCETFREIGHYLPKTETIVFSKFVVKKDNKENEDKKNKALIPIGFNKFGTVFLYTGNKDHELKQIFEDKETTEVLDINNTSFDKKYITGFKFMGKTVPEVIEKIPKDEAGEDEDIEKGQIAPFTYLAKYSDGDERIGIVRMDVDNLGKIFSDGLKDKISISRIATLSRSLDLFFAGYLNKICESLSDEYKKDYPEAKINNFFYILYSGGDDVFLVAPWDKAIDIAEKIQTDFEKYACNNPNVTISAGYLQTKPKFPIRVGADLAGETEEIAKNSGKNRICVLGDVLKWKEIKDIKNIAEEWAKDIENKNLQRGFIYAIHRLKEQFLKDKNKKDKLVFTYKEQENPMFYPYAQYYIARNISKDYREKIANFLLNKKNFKKLTFLVNYVALKTRK